MRTSSQTANIDVLQVAANLLRLGGSTGAHRLTKLDDRLRQLGSDPLPRNITPENAEQALNAIPALKGCFVTQNRKGELFVLEAGFQEVQGGGQEEAAYNEFIKQGFMNAEHQQAWNQILGDSCRRVCSEIETGVTKPEDRRMMRAAIGLFQSHEGDDTLARQFNDTIKGADITILTRLEEKHSSFSVPGAEGLMVHQLHAPQCSNSAHNTMLAVHHSEMAQKHHGVFPAVTTIQKAQESSFDEAKRIGVGVTVHTTLIGNSIYVSQEEGYKQAVEGASKKVFHDRRDVNQTSAGNVAQTIRNIRDNVSVSPPADLAMYQAEGPEIKQARISDLVKSFFQFFQHKDNTNKDNTRSQSEDTTLYDAKNIGEAASKLPIKEVIHHPDGKLEITVSESFYRIYDSLPDKDKNTFKEILKAGIEGRSIDQTQQRFLDDLGTMQEMNTKAAARNAVQGLDMEIFSDAQSDGKAPATTPAVPSKAGGPQLGGG